VITFLTVVHITVCIFMALIVLLQHGKGADVGATFGGAGNTIFGPRGAATLLSKMTTVAAVVFMVTSLSLAFFSARESTQSVFTEKSGGAPATTPAPETTASPAAVPTGK
jgi:preprotein translocase subunit SecG